MDQEAKNLLARRLANGEITKAQYLDLVNTIEGACESLPSEGSAEERPDQAESLGTQPRAKSGIASFIKWSVGIVVLLFAYMFILGIGQILSGR